MSFWILTYNNINKPYYTGPVGLYETQDEAVEASIIHFCGNGLSETPDGKIWFKSCEPIGLPIELKDLRKRIKKGGILDTENIWNNDPLNCKLYYSIVKMEVTKHSKMVPLRVVLSTEQHKCSDCGENFNIHRFSSPALSEISPGCQKCRDCNTSGICLIPEYSDKWYCSDICKQSKHEQLSSEKQNEELRGCGKNYDKNHTFINVRCYRNFKCGKRKVYRSESGIIFIEKGSDIIAIGLDIENDGLLKMISTVKHSLFLKNLKIEIDEGWRKGNKKPVLFFDYLKMTYKEKN